LNSHIFCLLQASKSSIFAAEPAIFACETIIFVGNVERRVREHGFDALAGAWRQRCATEATEMQRRVEKKSRNALWSSLSIDVESGKLPIYR
jgi:hypothetical protein